MTDSEITGPDPSAASAPAAPWTPPAAHDLVAQFPGAVAPRRRRRWMLLTFATVAVVGGLTAGLVVWAPWIPPPVLRPAGLVAGPATANSISFRWSPPTGPLPDKYLILSDGKVIASVAGTATSYKRVGLTPAARYRYRLMAVRDGKRSPLSAVVAMSTLTPPIAYARLQGSWIVRLTYTRRISIRGARHGTLFWQAVPACAAGACDVSILVQADRHSFTASLIRAGAVYRGHVVVNFLPCGKGANSIPDPATLTFRIRVTAAAGKHQWWAATSLAGTMTENSSYVSNGASYCPASTAKATLSGRPS